MSGIVNSLGAVSGVIGKTVGAGVPADLVAYRASGTSTPSGFTEYTTARGRMICGMPSSGTDGGTVGTALTNTQNKAGSHSHTMSSHSHTSAARHDAGSIYQDNNDSSFWGTGAAYNSASLVWTSDSTHSTVGLPMSLTNTNNSATSTNGVATSDVMAYIQLMAIKKD